MLRDKTMILLKLFNRSTWLLAWACFQIQIISVHRKYFTKLYSSSLFGVRTCALGLPYDIIICKKTKAHFIILTVRGLLMSITIKVFEKLKKKYFYDDRLYLSLHYFIRFQSSHLAYLPVF